MGGCHEGLALNVLEACCVSPDYSMSDALGEAVTGVEEVVAAGCLESLGLAVCCGTCCSCCMGDGSATEAAEFSCLTCCIECVGCAACCRMCCRCCCCCSTGHTKEQAPDGYAPLAPPEQGVMVGQGAGIYGVAPVQAAAYGRPPQMPYGEVQTCNQAQVMPYQGMPLQCGPYGQVAQRPCEQVPVQAYAPPPYQDQSSSSAGWGEVIAVGVAGAAAGALLDEAVGEAFD